MTKNQHKAPAADASRPARHQPNDSLQCIWREIRKAPRIGFHFGFADFGSAYMGYHPDAHAKFDEHPEFKQLFRRFRRRNPKNNSGDIARLWSLILNLKQVIADGIPGDFAEVGVWRGNTAAVLAHLAAQDGREVLLFDTFDGFDARDLAGIDADKSASQFANTSISIVREVIGDAISACRLVPGYFPETIDADHRQRTYAAVSLDCDLYEPMKAGLEFFYPRMASGAILMLHDYSSQHWEGARQAIDEFCAEHREFPVLMPDKSGSAFLRKSHRTRVPPEP